MAHRRQKLKQSQRIVIKVGTSTLTYPSGSLNFSRIDRLARVISDLMNQGREVILVTSGAIGVGAGKLGMPEKPMQIREKQAAAAVGQCELMHLYSKLFAEYGYLVGQMLLTRDVMGDETCRKNVINTFNSLLEKKVVPIVNENDSVSVVEIKVYEKNTFSENDRLAAIVAKLIHADILIILSDIEGFYDADPRTHPDSRLISVIDQITPQVEECAAGAGSKRGTGGMVTKLAAAKLATAAGVNVVLANGEEPDNILAIINGREKGTLFAARQEASNEG